MLQSMPVQLVFERDITLNTPFVADWKAIRRCKQCLIDKNNQNKNKDRKLNIYRVREKVLVRDNKGKNTRIHKSSLTWLQRFSNGTVDIL